MPKKTKIYIGVTQGTSLYSKLIKWFQWGNPNVHNFYLYEDGYKKEDPIIIESIIGYGVHQTNLSVAHKTGTPYEVYSLEVTPEQKKNLEDFLLKQVGKKYDHIGLIGFASRKDTNDTDRFFCSELLYQGLLKVGIKLFNTLRPIQIFPSLLMEPTNFKFEYKSKTI